MMSEPRRDLIEMTHDSIFKRSLGLACGDELFLQYRGHPVNLTGEVASVLKPHVEAQCLFLEGQAAQDIAQCFSSSALQFLELH